MSEKRARQLARLYAVSSSMNEAMIGLRCPAEIYSAACRIPVEKGLAVLAWLGSFPDSSDTFEILARHGQDQGYLKLVQLPLSDQRMIQGPVSQARRTGRPCLINEVGTQQGFYWKEEALKRGFQALAAFPLDLGARGEGVLVIYGDRPNFFCQEEVDVLTVLARNVSFALELGERELERAGLIQALGERVKELSTLHGVSRLLQAQGRVDKSLLSKIVELVPGGFSFPDLTAARLSWAGVEVQSPHWQESEWRLVENFDLGCLEVVYLSSSVKDDPFLEEERELLRSLTDILAAHFRRAGNKERKKFLQKLGDRFSEVQEAEQIMLEAVTLLGRHLGVSRCNYALVDEDGDRFLIPQDYTESCESMVGRFRLTDFGVGVYEILTRGSGLVVVPDVHSALPGEAGEDALESFGIRAFVCCALKRQGNLKALMSVHQDKARAWRHDEVTLISEVAQRCWAGMEQKAAEAKLRHRDSLLRIAGSAAKIGGWSIELPDFHLRWSEEVCALHEVPPELIPSNEEALRFYSPEYRQSVSQAIAKCLSEATAFDLEAQLQTAGERTLWVRLMGQAEVDAQGKVVRVQGALQDISERRKLEEQLHQIQKLEAVGQLAGGVAHDFNNLLTVILGYTSFALQTMEPDNPLREDLEEISRAGERACELTRQLLAFSRKQVLQPQVIDLNRIVHGLQKMLRRLVGEHIQISSQTQENLGRVLADPSQMEQVIVNLMVNARDALPKGGNVTIETGSLTLQEGREASYPGIAPGSYVMLSVADSGCGMDLGVRTRIFEPFFTTKPKGKGTGLGLSTVWGIVRQSGGHITVESEIGVGSVFRVYLPRVDQEITEVASNPLNSASQGSETVLLVEDELQVRTVIKTILKNHGYHVLEAQNGGEAFLLCEAYDGEIDLMLTDMVMPFMSGRELAKRVSRMRPNMKVLYMSGFPEDAFLDQDQSLQSSACLLKPIRPEPLLQKVEEVLNL